MTGPYTTFVWLLLVVAGMILFAMPPLTAAQVMLLLDRYLGPAS
jgi:cytochrome c oxidase subunit 1